MRKLSRKEAEEKMEAIFSALHYNLMDAMNAGGERTGEESYFHAEAWKVDQGRQKEDYRQTVMSLDSVGFKEYYKLVGQFATAYKIGCWKEYSECEPVLIEELGEEFGRCEKTKEKLELINSFTAEELHSQTFSFDAKIKVLQDILDDFSVGNEKEEVINRLLASFSGKDSSAFIARLQSDGKLLNGLLGRVNGGDLLGLLASESEKKFIAWQPESPKIDTVYNTLIPSQNKKESFFNQDKESKMLWSEATFVDNKGENSADMAVGVLSVSSELNDKNNTLFLSQGQFDLLNASFNFSTTDRGIGTGFSVNVVSVSGKIGIQFPFRGRKVQVLIGGAVGFTAGMEIKADAASGIVLDIGAILKPRVEINWEKELKR